MSGTFYFVSRTFFAPLRTTPPVSVAEEGVKRLSPRSVRLSSKRPSMGGRASGVRGSITNGQKCTPARLQSAGGGAPLSRFSTKGRCRGTMALYGKVTFWDHRYRANELRVLPSAACRSRLFSNPFSPASLHLAEPRMNGTKGTDRFATY